MVEQAARRSQSYICTVDEYMTARRDNIGSDPTFALMEVCLNLDIPHEVMQHPAMLSLNRDATDMIILTNVCHLRL